MSFFISFQNKIWTTLEKDPIFHKSRETLTVEKQREQTFRRCKRLFEYDFVTEQEIFENPLKHQMFTDTLGMYDWSLLAKYQLDTEVYLPYTTFCFLSIACMCKNQYLITILQKLLYHPQMYNYFSCLIISLSISLLLLKTFFLCIIMTI